MAWWFAALLGVVQGLTEFLPISSTAHLRIFPELTGQPDPGAAYSAVVQLGTLVAVMGYFARELFVEMPRALIKDRKSDEARLAFYLVLGTIPIVIAGLLLQDFVTDKARSLYVVGAMLIFVGGLFFFAERGGDGSRDIKALGWKDAAIIGLAQACALIPGVSRSGATITAALFLGMRRAEGARFSFLLGVPAIAGAGIYQMKDALDALGDGAWTAIVIGTTAAAISGYATIHWLLRFLGRNSLAPFGVYRITLGILVIALCIGGVLAPGS